MRRSRRVADHAQAVATTDQLLIATEVTNIAMEPARPMRRWSRGDEQPKGGLILVVALALVVLLAGGDHGPGMHAG